MEKVKVYLKATTRLLRSQTYVSSVYVSMSIF